MEGSDYLDNSESKDKLDNKISPGGTYKYKWTVPQRAGPGPNDTNCITWAYYSDVDSVKDANSGLVGPIVICRKVCIVFTLIINTATALHVVYFMKLNNKL
jgi:hypothetical protein